ncbi:hypothetical protein K7887_13305 [Sutcliffiella horikoshii]|uniref:hypothetical protein n=1 Tax=Sutcliffiella horikoshii TaxID=79883 RepID=UPI001CBFBE26|nr:hypothetical protein [Sutcliffiella horikoshii]UAL49701.1 hypothetical protein K7887_13305 [Sutcliffiella horikoshii]
MILITKIKIKHIFIVYILSSLSLILFTTVTNFNLTGYSYQFHENEELTIEKGYLIKDQVINTPTNEAIQAIELISKADAYWNVTYVFCLVFFALLFKNAYKSFRPENNWKRYVTFYSIVLIAFLVWIISSQVTLTEQIATIINDLKGGE